MSETVMEMPRYQCHKIVHGLQIEHFEYDIITENQETMVMLMPVRKQYDAFLLPAALVEKHSPKPGWYYVVYEDGYRSFSTPEAFESGYSEITEN